MKKLRWVSATAGAALVAAMFALPGAGVAYASDNGNTTGNGNVSVLSGNSITAPVSVPVNLCGISLAVAGFSNAGCAGGTSSTISGVGGHSHNGNVTGNFNIPIASGNTVTTPVSAPVNLCGISLALLGFSNAGCVGGAASTISGVGGHSHNGNVTGNFNVPVGSGNTITAPVSVPVNVCGNAVAAAGFANANCKGGSTSCIGRNCNRPCTHNCTPPCRRNCHTPPPCMHDCHTPPPGCTANCGGTPPGGTPPGGTGPGTTTVSTGTSPAGLPTTGADLLLLGVAALGTIGVGAGAVAVARRRRNSEV
jgi:ChpA-C